MLILLRNILVIFTLLCTNYAYSLNSSSYLVASRAINLLDFDKSILEIAQLNQDLTETDLNNQLLSYVGLNLFSDANSVAKKIINKNPLNEEAWIVYLANAIITNDLNIISEYQKHKNKPKLDLLNYIFFYKNGDIKNTKLIAKSIFEVIQTSLFENQNQITYKYLLFYLSISTFLDPNFKSAYFYSGQIYQIIENYSKAEFFYKKIPNDHNLFIDSQKNIAINKTKLGFHNEGIQILKKLLNNDDKDINLLVAIADLYRFQKNYNDAINYYSKVINLDNNSYLEYWNIFYLRGICFERLKNWNYAEEDFLYSLKIKSNSPEVLNYLAYGWLERDINLDKAMQMLKEAYLKNPDSHYIADSLAWAFYKKDKLKKAADLMEKVILMAPGEAISLYHLGDIYYAMSRKREASYLAEPIDGITDKIIKKLEIYNAG